MQIGLNKSKCISSFYCESIFGQMEPVEPLYVLRRPIHIPQAFLFIYQGTRCFDFQTTSQEERKAYHEARRAQTTAAPKKQLTKAWHHELGTSGKRRQV